jgi:hypothetical protein
MSQMQESKPPMDTDEHRWSFSTLTSLTADYADVADSESKPPMDTDLGKAKEKKRKEINGLYLYLYLYLYLPLRQWTISSGRL